VVVVVEEAQMALKHLLEWAALAAPAS